MVFDFPVIEECRKKFDQARGWNPKWHALNASDEEQRKNADIIELSPMEKQHL
jgi:hypothetical protein